MDKESDEFILRREIAVAEMGEKYPNWDPYWAAQSIQRWHHESSTALQFERWLQRSAAEFFLSKREFNILYLRHDWDKSSAKEIVSWSYVLRDMGLKYMKTRVLLWQFVYGCFQAGFMPRRAPWE